MPTVRHTGRHAPRLLAGIATLVVAGLALIACAAGSGAPADPAAAYCVEKGGTVQERQPTFGTNDDPSTWVELGQPVAVCRFQADDEADSRIYLDLVTLYSEKPTLAALAYLAKTPIPEGATGNPASALCVELGGAVSYGSGASGGGLVAQDDPDDIVIAPCVFADASFIEEWGIAYYADGTVRGADLAKLFRFDVSTLPAVF